MTDQQQYKFGIIPSPHDERDWKAEAILKEITLPTTYDIRNQLPSPRDQGSQGSCVAMGAAAMKEWQEMNDKGFDDKYMSPQFIYNLRENQGSEGMTTRDLMKILQKYGVCPEKYFIYGQSGKPPQSAINAAYNYRINNYATIDTIDGAKTALLNARQGLLPIVFPVYNYSDEFWKPWPGESLLGYHLVDIASYLEDAFIIRNSWGNWSGDGYTLYPFNDWGYHIECWTTIDMDSLDDPPIPPPDPTPFKLKLWHWVLIVAGAISLILWLTLAN